MSTKAEEKKGLNISAKSFLSAILVIFLLMVGTYILTFTVPGGGIPFWKWILSPVLVLGAEGNGSLIAVLLFLLVIGFYDLVSRVHFLHLGLDVSGGLPLGHK